MFLINGFKATLRQFNRVAPTTFYDDQVYQDISIKIIPYDLTKVVRFGVYTHPEAKGSFMTKRNVDVRDGDQLIYDNHTYTIIEVGKDSWLYNRLEYKVLVVK